MRAAPYPPGLAATLVFAASAAVLVLEILGIRLLAPYVGLTLETTTLIIGTVLAGIAAGAAAGGRAADRVDGARLVPELLLGGGLLAIATVPVVRLLGPALQDGGDPAALVITLVALFPSAAVLSAVTPVVVKTQLRDLAGSGTVVGRLSAWSTSGGLFGVFASGFVLVPILPTATAVFAVGGALALAGLALFVFRGGRERGSRRRAAGIVGAALLVGVVTLGADSTCDAESTYHCVRVEGDPQRPGGRTLILDDLHHSYVDLDDHTHLEFDYTRWIGDAIDAMAPSRRPLDAVFLGGGGYTLPRYLAATRPGSRSRVLEIDAALPGVARSRLGLRTGPDLRVRVGDARVTLRDEPEDSADLVVGDAFGGRSVPWHLATSEFVAEIRRVLRPGGLYALNVIDYRPLGLLRAEAATLLDAFADVALVSLSGADGAPAGGNLILLASDARLPRGVRSSARGASSYGRDEIAALVDGAEALRDDDAPADQLLTPRP